MANLLIRGSLVIALLLSAASGLLSAAGYFMLPAQVIETTAELKQSQKSGLPITDRDIDAHIGRLESSRRIYGLLCVPNAASLVATATALALLAQPTRSIGSP